MAESIRRTRASGLRRFKRARRTAHLARSRSSDSTEIPCRDLVPNVALKRSFDLEGAVRAARLSVLARAIESGRTGCGEAVVARGRCPTARSPPSTDLGRWASGGGAGGRSSWGVEWREGAARTARQKRRLPAVAGSGAHGRCAVGGVTGIEQALAGDRRLGRSLSRHAAHFAARCGMAEPCGGCRRGASRRNASIAGHRQKARHRCRRRRAGVRAHWASRSRTLDGSISPPEAVLLRSGPIMSPTWKTARSETALAKKVKLRAARAAADANQVPSIRGGRHQSTDRRGRGSWA